MQMIEHLLSPATYVPVRTGLLVLPTLGGIRGGGWLDRAGVFVNGYAVGLPAHGRLLKVPGSAEQSVMIGFRLSWRRSGDRANR